MAIKDEFLLEHHQLIHYYVCQLDVFRHLYPQLHRNKLPKGNVIDVLIQEDVNNQPNIYDISASNVTWDCA